MPPNGSPMVVRTMERMSVDWDRCREFSGYLHSAPTAAMDRYRFFCIARNSSPDYEREFLLASETLKLVFQYKNWDSLSHEELTSRGLFINTLADVNVDILNALIDSQIPMLWADIIVEEGTVVTKHANLVFQCFFALGGPWTSSILEASTPSLCRNLVPADFALAHFLKCVDILSVCWNCKEAVEAHVITFMEGFTDQMVQIRQVYEFDRQLLIDSKIAHVALWSMSNRHRLDGNGRRLASLSCFHAFRHVFDAVMERDAPQAWMSEVVKSIGAKDLMAALRTVVFISTLVDEILAIAVQTLYNIASLLPDQCGVQVVYAPSEFLRQCSLVLNRQLNTGLVRLGKPPRSFEHSAIHSLAVWEHIYRLHLLPAFHDESVALDMTVKIGYSIFSTQLTGAGLILRALEHRSRITVPSGTQGTPDAILCRVATAFYDQTAAWIANIHKHIDNRSYSALAIKREYVNVAREKWVGLASQLHVVRSRLGHEAAYGPLMRTWSMIGTLAGLHFDRMCSSEPCQYHRTPSEKPLLICKGCQEVRYCSRECQRNDWKERHKVQCRRIKPKVS
ncbi:hypothetical protein PENSPDRAFT_748965 [Peniophora sp. CONT]|nr:hypothetical protein PENSPDRAFT_748965 [Peniophora sp. CONT]